MSLSLSALRSKTDSKYGSVPFDPEDGKGEVELLNILRFPKERRVRFEALLKDLQGEKAEERVFELLELLPLNPADGKRVVKAVDGDLAVAMTLFEDYSDATNVGEASASQD